MRYKGKELRGPRLETIVFPRPATYGGEAATPVEINNDIAIQAQAVLDYDEFDSICPPPLPPRIIRPGKGEGVNLEDPKYTEELTAWSIKKNNWVILKSLSVCTDLEWETVKLNDPDTYENFRDELKEAGFNQAEIGKIVQLAFNVNSIDESRMEEARERFFREQSALQ